LQQDELENADMSNKVAHIKGYLGIGGKLANRNRLKVISETAGPMQLGGFTVLVPRLPL
jgi:hypothetical protein